MRTSIIKSLSLKAKAQTPVVIIAACFVFSFGLVNAQNAGINTSGTTPNASAILDLNTGNNFTSPGGKGLLIPTVKLTGNNDGLTITTPAVSLLVYVPTSSGLTPAGYYYNSGSSTIPFWTQIGTGGGGTTVSIKDSAWLLTGNANTTPATNFIGTTNDRALRIKINNKISGRVEDINTANGGYGNTSLGYLSLNTATGVANVAMGDSAMGTNTTGSFNTAIGYQSFVGPSTQSGSFNVALGYQALNTTIWGTSGNTGSDNIAIGNQALSSITTASQEIGIGDNAGATITTGIQNTAIGYYTMWNMVGNPNNNTAVGYMAMLGGANYTDPLNNNTAVGTYALENVASSDNTAVGYNALAEANDAFASGANNTAVGSGALSAGNAPNDNTAVGYNALALDDNGCSAGASGNYNTGMGYEALYNVHGGNNNTSLGYQAALNTGNNINRCSGGNNNTAVGYNALLTNTFGSNNTVLGYSADVAFDSLVNATAIGNGAVVSKINNMMFGNTAVVGWGFGATPNPATQALIVGTSGLNGNGANLTLTGNWASTSDSTKKRDIKNIAYGLSDIMKLRPVSYRWKGTDKHDIGFLAQEVKHVLPEIVYGEEGHMTLSYGQITPVLVKAMQEQQHMIDSLKNANAILKDNQAKMADKLDNANKTTAAKIEQLQSIQAKDQADIAELKKMIYSSARTAEANK